MSDNSRLLRAITLYRKGELSHAIIAFESIIASDPSNCDALHYFGILKAAMGNLSEAEPLLKKSLSAQGTRVPYTENYAQILLQARRYEDAVRICRDTIRAHGASEKLQYALAISLFKDDRLNESLCEFDKLLNECPQNNTYYNERGSVLAKLARFDEALHYIEKSLAINPKNAGALLNKGNLLTVLHKYSEALDVYHEAFSITPRSADLFLGRANALRGLKRYKQALASYDNAVSINPNLAEAWLGRGNVFWDLKRYAEALSAYDRALFIEPILGEAWLGRGNVFRDLERYDDAIAAYDKALSIKTDSESVWLGRGNVFTDLKRYDDAFEAYDKALSIKPALEDAWVGRGNALADLGHHEEAFATYNKALSVNPHCGEAHFNQGVIKLVLGDTECGWKKYEWRWETKEMRGAKRDFLQPQWPGANDINRKTILIHAEQGLGDTIMGCRYIPMVSALGAQVVVEVQPPLKSLLQKIDGISTLIAKGEPIPHFDVHCPLMSLPLAFNTTLENIPSKIPYLSVLPNIVEKWRSKVVGPGIKIGVAWAGNPRFPKDRDRSVLLQNILPIVGIKGARFFCVQKDLREGDNTLLDANPEIVRLDREIYNFQDTAAIITLLDLIISSDTSIVHLAGALGTSVWVLLPFNADWRWLLNREDSPWYPTARLFRQLRIADWTSVVGDVYTQLEKLTAQKK
jgi:tetratricopeptide (TPR) repeat protein